MAKTLIIPAAVRYQNELAATLTGLKANQAANDNLSGLLAKLSGLTEKTITSIAGLDKAAQGHDAGKMIEGMKDLRTVVDSLEEIMPVEYWPLPSYTEMMFLM